MKKLFVLSIIFFFAIALAGFTPVKADSIVVNGSYTDSETLTQADYDELQNTALLLEYLRQGGVIDTSNVSAGYSVSDLVSDFGDFVKEVVPDLIDVINPFQSKFEYTPLGNAMLNSNMTKFLGLLPFYALNGPDVPIPQPDPDYLSYIDIINGSGFDKFKNLGNGVSGVDANYNKYSTSWDLVSIFGDTYQGISNDNTLNSYIYASPITDINIYSSNGVYNCLVTFDTYEFFLSTTAQRFYTNQAGQYNSRWLQYFSNDNTNHSTWTHTFTGTLEDVFFGLSRCCRNVNIYVDGVPWSIVGSSQNYTLTLYNDTVPDIATNDYGYVHWVYDYEIFFRIDRIWDILQDILDNMGNGGQTIIRWPDVDDVIVDVDGQPAVAVKIYTPDSNIDEDYISTYGPLVPIFVPLATPVINDSDILLIASTPMSALPDDLLDVFGYIFIGMLFVCFIHRLLE